MVPSWECELRNLGNPNRGTLGTLTPLAAIRDCRTRHAARWLGEPTTSGKRAVWVQPHAVKGKHANNALKRTLAAKPLAVPNVIGIAAFLSNYFVGSAAGSAVAAAVGSAATTLNFTSRHLPLSFGSQTFTSRFSIFAWNVPGSSMSFGLSGTSS
jgi:hypothetical protein